ncbi:pancreatic lipase-related protein 2-like [Aricia agestis]|uniref:pancreatic lipase-related protein 2-like n=1 Tax=Aricia agestis TaxID=91739 RepID=UPI001C2031A8|nr:pancreatic lipase-related protein 2-like [Aricia agestis]
MADKTVEELNSDTRPVTATAIPVEDSPTVVNVAGGNLQPLLQNGWSSEITDDSGSIEYYLYTKSNPTTAQRLYMNEESIKSSSFNPEHPTVVVAHGFLGSHNSALNPAIRDAHLGKADTNVIILNWNRIGGEDDDSALLSTPVVGRRLGQFLKFLSQVSGASYDKMHLIGFSLGAHLVGSAGKELDGKIARITGLDPAGRLWQVHPERLSSSDAQYVEGIHTSKEFGINSEIGHADFFANGGESQPGCLTPICSHYRAWQLYVATVEYNHLEGRRCSGLMQLLFDMCNGDMLYMGNNDFNKRGSGLYRVNTGWRYPY